MARLIDALRRWLAHVVIVGGWAHRLYRLHPQAATLPYEPVRTRDADLAFSVHAPLEGNIGEALKAAHFEKKFIGEHTPPAIHYQLGTEDEGFYAEFLVPLVGSGMRRRGLPHATAAKAGVIAQRLRHLDLLLMTPWTIQLGPTTSVPLERAADVQLANPVSFIAQKLLIQRERAPDKQAQDALYIHDTIELFGAELEPLRALWVEQLRPKLPARLTRNVERLWREQFGGVTDAIRSAARIPVDRMLSVTRMQQLCAYGLKEIFRS